MKGSEIDVLAQRAGIQIERRSAGQGDIEVALHRLEAVGAALVQLSIEIDVPCRHPHVNRRAADVAEMNITVYRIDAYVAVNSFKLDFADIVLDRHSGLGRRGDFEVSAPESEITSRGNLDIVSHDLIFNCYGRTGAHSRGDCSFFPCDNTNGAVYIRDDQMGGTLRRVSSFEASNESLETPTAAKKIRVAGMMESFLLLCPAGLPVWRIVRNTKSPLKERAAES